MKDTQKIKSLKDQIAARRITQVEGNDQASNPNSIPKKLRVESDRIVLTWTPFHECVVVVDQNTYELRVNESVKNIKDINTMKVLFYLIEHNTEELYLEDVSHKIGISIEVFKKIISTLESIFNSLSSNIFTINLIRNKDDSGKVFFTIDTHRSSS